MTNLSQKPTADLVDQLGLLKAEKAEIAKQENAIKSVLAGRLPATFPARNTFAGNLFDVTLSWVRRETLDATRIRAMFKATGAEVPVKVSNARRWDVEARSTAKVAA